MQETVLAAGADKETLVKRVDELSALYDLTDKLYRARSLEDVYEAALDAIVETLGCERASILVFDEAGVMRFVASRGLSADYRRKVEGHTPWKPGERDPQPIFVEDIAETDEADWLKEVVEREGIRGLAFIPLVAQGGVVGKFMTYYAEPHAFADRETDLAVTIARQVGFSLERSRAEQARRVAEEELRQSEERFRLMSEHAPVMIWTSDAKGHCLQLNSMLRTFWGVDESAISDFNWLGTIHPDDAPTIGRLMGDAIAARRNVTLEGRYRNAAGQYRVLKTDARPYFSAKGEYRGMIGVNVDITERAEADAQRELLLAELNHRVKNTLAVVQGIAHQTFRGGDASAAARNAFEGRLVALAAAHNLLTQSNWEAASLQDLAADALQAASENGRRITLRGPRILLQPREALAVAMALHELYTNAVKYGALSNDTGRITLEWTRSEGSPARLKLIWREEGGPPVAPPRRRGFGSRLVERTLAQDLDGEVRLEFRPEGLVCSIDAPLSPGPGAQ